jgi:thiamine-monophosphate kinase
MALSEFGLIERFFHTAALSPDGARGVVLGIGDDAAILRLPPAHDLCVSIDTLVSGVHFPADTPAWQVGWRALAVNLSDLAAMGAEPLWFTLALTLEQADAQWLESFADGLASLASRHAIALVGGDTTRGPLSVTIQVHGITPAGSALRRDGARVGDEVYVSGQPGLAALGLQRMLAGAGVDDPAVALFLHPQPRVALGLGLRGLASAAIDVSDGLLADAGHIAGRSGVGIEIDAQALPLQPLLQQSLTREEALRLCLAGGDDYELCFTAPSGSAAAVQTIAAQLGLRCTRIGTVVSGAGAHCRGVALAGAGYQHFGAV